MGGGVYIKWMVERGGMGWDGGVGAVLVITKQARNGWTKGAWSRRGRCRKEGLVVAKRAWTDGRVEGTGER